VSVRVFSLLLRTPARDQKIGKIHFFSFLSLVFFTGHIILSGNNVVLMKFQ